MFEWNNFERMFNEMFSPFGNNNEWNKRVFRSSDGNTTYTFMSRGINASIGTDEIDILKSKLENAVENQDFEMAVKLRDKIKNLEKNHEEIKKLNEELNKNIESQDFEKCIEIRNKIKSLK
jgi:protein-arginine kinase activator protein McsA